MPNRSGGSNAVSIEQHKLRGTFKPSRHGQRAATSPDHPWQPSAPDLKALGTVGRRFVRDWLARYDVTKAEGAVLLEAAWATERLAALRGQSREGLTLREAAALARLELASSKLLAALLAQLRVR